MTRNLENFFSNLAESLLGSLRDPSSKYNLESVFVYYSNFSVPQVFHIDNTSAENVFKIMENIESSKAAVKKNPQRDF